MEGDGNRVEEEEDEDPAELPLNSGRRRQTDSVPSFTLTIKQRGTVVGGESLPKRPKPASKRCSLPACVKQAGKRKQTSKQASNSMHASACLVYFVI